MNPCPCGYAGDKTGQCHCTGEQIQRYRARISGPLLDRDLAQLSLDLVFRGDLPRLLPGSLVAVLVREEGKGTQASPACVSGRADAADLHPGGGLRLSVAIQELEGRHRGQHEQIKYDPRASTCARRPSGQVVERG